MFGLLIAALAAPLLALAAPTQLSKRTSGRATYYQVGLGACGGWNNPGDFIVALNQAQFETGGYPSTQCGRTITITYNGKSTQATVTDECPNYGCNYGDLDMSEGLFTFFEPTSTGVFYMTWDFTDGAAPAPPPSPAYTPPTSTYTPPPPTTTWTPPPPPTTTSTTSTTPSSSPSSSSSSSSSYSSDQVQAQDVPSDDAPAPAPTADGNALDSVNKAAIHLANLVFAAGHAA